MKKYLLSTLFIVLSGSLAAANASPVDDVKSAAAALGNQTNYSWEATVEVPADSQFKPGPTDGKTEKGGYTSLEFSFNDNKSEALMMGTNGAVKTEDGWKSLADAASSSGGGGGGLDRGGFLVRMVRNYRLPTVESAGLADDAKDLQSTNGAIAGDLTEDGAKKLLSFRGRGGNTTSTVSNAKGSVKFWIKDGKLAKYQYHVEGTVSFNGNDRDVNRTTTVEIKDVNSTKVDVSDEAKKALQ